MKSVCFQWITSDGFKTKDCDYRLTKLPAPPLSHPDSIPECNEQNSSSYKSSSPFRPAWFALSSLILASSRSPQEHPAVFQILPRIAICCVSSWVVPAARRTIWRRLVEWGGQYLRSARQNLEDLAAICARISARLCEACVCVGGLSTCLGICYKIPLIKQLVVPIFTARIFSISL